jgi:serine protease Do
MRKMRLKNKRLILPLLAVVALTSFVIGVMISSSLKITPAIKATEKGFVESSGDSPINNSQVFVKLAEKLMPATVNISTTKIVKRRKRSFHQPFREDDPYRDFFGDEFFDRFFGQMPQRDYKLRSLGSGFIIDEEGYIITNNHVIEGADEIKVRLSDKEEYDAKIVGKDIKTDIALIKIDPPNGLPVVELGNSDELKVGEWVMAIGNPFGLNQTVTVGIISAKWRKIGAGPYENFIQTDAAINQGNSGGPLFNTRGEVVGVNTAIFSTTGGNIGIGFATPINLAKNVVKQLKEKGKVVRGWLGVIVQTVTPELADSFGLKNRKGALVADVEEGAPADEAGIRKGDIIIAFDGKKIEEMSELPLVVAQTQVGKKVDVTILRNGKELTKKVKIGELKEEEADVFPGEKSRTDIGMEVNDLNRELARKYGISETKGVLVTYVENDSPAERAGIREGDIIIEVNREPVKNLDEYYKATKQAKKGDKILFWIKRGRSSQFVVVKLEE